MASQYRLIIKNAKQLVTVCGNGEKMKIGKQMDEVTIARTGPSLFQLNNNNFKIILYYSTKRGIIACT